MTANKIIEKSKPMVTNEGPERVATNYWKTPDARAGKLRLVPSAGTVQLLVPRLREDEIDEMRTRKEVWISRGPWEEKRSVEAFEILFGDHHQRPHAICLTADSVIDLPSDEFGSKFGFTVWVEDENGGCHCVLRTTCGYRIVPKIPWMKL